MLTEEQREQLEDYINDNDSIFGSCIDSLQWKAEQMGLANIDNLSIVIHVVQTEE